MPDTSFTPITPEDLKLCVEGLVADHDYIPSEVGDFDAEDLTKLIGHITGLDRLSDDIEYQTLYVDEGDDVTCVYIEVRVRVGKLLITDADHLDPYDYATEYTEESFANVVGDLINDINQRACRVRDELAAYKNGE